MMRGRTVMFRRASGFSLIEFITSGALTLLLLAGVGAIFIGARTSYGKAEQLGQIQENGRYALDQISRDIRVAGFPGCSHRIPFTATATPAALMPLRTALRAFEAKANGTWEPAPSSKTSHLAMPGSDVLEITTTSAPIALRAAMQSDTDVLRIERSANQQPRRGDVLLASNCQARAMFTVTSIADDVLYYEALPISDPEHTSQSLGFSFPIGTELMQIRTHTYFLRAEPSAARPALWRQVDDEEPEQLASGIAEMQFAFGVDLDEDGVVDRDTTADQISDWAQVITVSITLLVVADNSDKLDALQDTSSDLRETFTAAVTLRNRVAAVPR